MVTQFWIRISFFILFMSTTGFARTCDEHCLEELLAQITTLRAEIKSAIPIGTILPYSGSQALPPGYISCNGQLLNQVGIHHRLFEIIGYSFTGASEQGGTQFRVPNLNGKTMVGTKPEGTPIVLGDSIGSETQQLSKENLPPHQHGGTTQSNNRSHTHAGRTHDDSPDHIHHYPRFHVKGNYLHQSGPGTYGVGSPDAEQQQWVNATAQGSSTGASTRHQHDFTTQNQSQNHEHPFTTDTGSDSRFGLTSAPFSVMQPSLGVRFMIKAE